MSFDEPNYTQTPNKLFDELLPTMSNAELRVVLVAVRKTVGYHKDSDAISLTMFQKLTGLSRQGVIDGIAAAVEHKLIRQLDVTGKRKTAVYALNIGLTSQASRLVKPVDQSNQLTSTSQASRPQTPVTSQASRHTKEKELKEKKKDKAAAATPAPAHEENLTPNAFSLWERNITVLTSLVADAIRDALAHYPAEWVEDAIRETALSGGKGWKYTDSILKRWEVEGRNTPRPQANGNGKPRTLPEPVVPRTRAPSLAGFDANQMLREMAAAGTLNPGWNPFENDEENANA